MEWSSDADTSFSSLNPTSSKEEDLFSTSLVSSTTSDVDIIDTTLHVETRFSSPVSPRNPPCSSPKMCTSLPGEDQTCRKSKILPPSLLLSVTKKVQDGTVSKSEISSNDLKACLSPGFYNVDSSSYKLLPQISPPSINSFINDNPSTRFLDSNIVSDVDSKSSPLTFLKTEISGDGEDDKLGSSVNSDASICTIYSDDETRNKLRVEKPAKRVPNYFISIQFSDPEIYGSLKEVHKSVMKKNGNCSLAAVPLHSLHMTLAVMRLDNEEEIARARSALNRCGDELRPKYSHELLELPLQGLGNFRHSVVFAKVHQGGHVAKLEAIADVVQRRFCEEGLVDNKHDFTPHVTVLKLSRVGKKLTKKTGLKKIYPDIYEEFVDSYFGTQKVHNLQLCSMLKAKDISGYYHVEHKIHFGVDDDGGTTMPIVNSNGDIKEDSSNLNATPIESATKQNNPEPSKSTNPEDLSLRNNIITNKLSSYEKKIEFECVISEESLNKEDTYPYKSEMFIHISGQEHDHDLPPQRLSIFQEKTEADDSVTEKLITTLPEQAVNLPENIPPTNKPVPDANFSSVTIHFPVNIFTSDKPVSDNNSSSVAINLAENIRPSNKPVSDANFSSVAIHFPVNIPPSDQPVSDNNSSSVAINLLENIPPSDKPVSDANFSSVAIHFPANIPPSDKPVSDNNSSSVAINLLENIPPSDKPVSDDQELKPPEKVSEKKITENNEADMPDYSKSSSDDMPLQEAVSTKTDLCSNEVVPILIINQAEGVVDKSSAGDINDSGINSSHHHLETSPSSSMTVTTTDNVITPQTPITFQDIGLTTAMVEETAVAQVIQMASPSSVLLDGLEFAEEATEGLSSGDLAVLSSGCDNPEGDTLIQNKMGDASSIVSETSDGDGRNIVPPMAKKRRKKMGKCSLM